MQVPFQKRLAASRLGFRKAQDENHSRACGSLRAERMCSVLSRTAEMREDP